MKNNKDTRQLEYKRLTATEFKMDEEKGIVEAYVSIFDNIDLYGDKIVKGAFAESLAAKYPKGVWMHNWDQPVAKTMEAREDEKGLYIKGQFNLDTQRGKEAFSDIKNGIIDEFSIGFRVQEYAYEMVDGDEIRVLKKIKLYEWSPVLAGANPDTELINAKGEQAEEAKETASASVDPEIGVVEHIKTDLKTGQVIIYVRGKEPQKARLSFKFSKYLKSLLPSKGAKVDPTPDTQKVLRIRQAVKQVDKTCEYILRITK